MIRWLFRWTYNSYDGPFKLAKGKQVDRHAELVGLKRKWFETDKRLRARIVEAIKGTKPKPSLFQRLVARRRAMLTWFPD